MTGTIPRKGPLSGYRVVELKGIGPGPYAGMVLADLGADVIVVERPVDVMRGIDLRGKRSIVLDLKKPEAIAALLKIVAASDVLIEGLRPGVTERLGIGPAQCHAVNPKLVYARMTGWGQSGPWSQMAGHDINYISMTGALHAMGKADQPPMPPLNIVGDFGGGSMFLVTGIIAALLRAEKTGQGDIVDAAIVDGVNSMMSFIYSRHGAGAWKPQREANLLDGGAPFYRCYTAADGKFVAVGCIEPQFFAVMMERLQLDMAAYGAQHDQSLWPQQHRMLETAFAAKTRDEWDAIFAGTDACVTPVLDYQEVAHHPANAARHTHITDADWTHPQIAPRFSGQDLVQQFPMPTKGSDYKGILAEAGMSADEIAELINASAVIAE